MYLTLLQILKKSEKKEIQEQIDEEIINLRVLVLDAGEREGAGIGLTVQPELQQQLAGEPFDAMGWRNQRVQLQLDVVAGKEDGALEG